MFSVMSHPAKSVVARIGTLAALALALPLPAAAPAARPAAGLCLSARCRRRASRRTCAMRAPTISPAGRCPATTPPNACCGARWRRRSPACRPISPRRSLGLKVYDCYRPTRAVARLRALGARAPTTTRPSASTPRSTRAGCSPLGYIAAHSAHSTGIAVDLTLVARDAPPAPPFDRARALTAPAPAPAAQRAPDNSLDMGTGFDCFDDSEPHGERRDHARAEALARRAASPPCAGAAFTIISANGGTSRFGARPAQAYDFPIEPRVRGDATGLAPPLASAAAPLATSPASSRYTPPASRPARPSRSP